MKRRLLLVLDALLVGLVGYLGVQLHHAWTAPDRPADAIAVQAPVPSLSGGPAADAEQPPLPSYAVVADKNLFNPNRVELSPEPTKGTGRTPPATAPPPRPRLYGIVILPDGKARAYLEDAQRKKIFAYTVGDAVADNRIEQIKNDRVVLRRGTEVFEVLLRDPTKPKPPQQAATNPFAAAAAALRGQEQPQSVTPGTPVNPFLRRPGATNPGQAGTGSPATNPFAQGAARRRSIPGLGTPSPPPAPAAAPQPNGQDGEEEEGESQ